MKNDGMWSLHFIEKPCSLHMGKRLKTDKNNSAAHRRNYVWKFTN